MLQHEFAKKNGTLSGLEFFATDKKGNLSFFKNQKRNIFKT